MNKRDSKRRSFFLLAVATIVVLGVLIFINNKTSRKSPLFSEGAYQLALTGEVETVSNNNSLMYCVDNLLLEAQSDNLRVKNIKGEVVWSQKLTGSIIKMTSAGDNIVIADSGNNISYYSLQGKLLWHYKAPYEITDIYAEENGSILIEYKGMTGGRAEVFSQGGNKIGNISVENANILSFSAGSNSFSISILDMSSDVVKTKIITYNFKGDILWANNFDNMLITKLNYTKNNRVLAVGENRILSYRSDGKLQGELKINGKICNVAMSDSLTVVVLNNMGRFYAVCYDSNNREQSRTEINISPLGLFPLKNNFVVYNKDELIVFSAKGSVLSAYKSNTDISRVYMTLDNKLYIVSNRKLQLLEYK
ncbi:MAG: DUF5711 family protein [Caulobacteraceae bacterium]